MNGFDNLLVELEDEDLLETTIVEKSNGSASIQIEAELLDLNEFNVDVTSKHSDDEILETERFLKELETIDQDKVDVDFLELDTKSQISLDSINLLPQQVNNEPQNLNPKRKLTEFEYFRKRAIDEVSLLQMIDNIFSSVEREQMKVIPKPYYDLSVKKILHSFIQLSGDVSLSEHTEAEFELMQETEKWYSALSQRDKQISVENLRYCCENTKPPLSPPALLSLARFYRNAPFTESVRNKFDLIITRLFLRDVEDNKRELVFTRNELTEHLKELYAEWESIPVYPNEEDNDEILVTVLKFEDFIAEARNAQVFDDLIRSEFFNRVRALKRSTGEHFFAPQIAATSIICNFEIGNRYLELLEIEQEQTFEESIEEKYGFLFDQSVSNATNKSVQIVEILKEQRKKPKKFNPESIKVKQTDKTYGQTTKNQQSIPEKFNLKFLKEINKGILALTVLSIIMSVGLYFWVDVFSDVPKLSDNVQEFSLENSEFKETIKSARISNETLFGISTTAWETTPREKKEEILNKLLAKGVERGYKKVHLLNLEGLTVGSATPSKIEIK